MTREIAATRLLVLVSICVLLLSAACASEPTPQSPLATLEESPTTEESKPEIGETTVVIDRDPPQAEGAEAGDEPKEGTSISRIGQLVETVSADDDLPTPTGEVELRAEPDPDALVKISVGSNHACGIRDDQTLVCWGGNESGQANPPEGSFTEIASGNGHSCAINTEAGVECWGNNSEAAASPPTSTFLKLDGYQYTYCGVQTNYAISCWGYQSSNGSWPAGKFQDLDIRGSDWGCAIESSQKTVCWGQSQPYAIEGRFQHISVGENDLACGVDELDVVRCWNLRQGKEFMKLYGEYREVSIGEDSWVCAVTLNNELSCSHGIPQLLPSQLEGIKIKSFEASPNEEVACVITVGGVPFCWGWDGSGIAYSLWGTKVP